MSFATLQEAWGVSTFGVQEMEPEAKQPRVQAEALERTEASQRSQAFVTNYLRETYDKRGVAGVMSLLDEEVLRELRTNALLSFEWLDTHTMLFVFMCLCALWLVLDVFRRT